ncbi:MAG: DUF4198 domain-containing protein [Steroidobacteraceae bacterium]
MHTLRIRIFATLFGLAAGLGAAGSRAHEFWVEPSTFAVARGGRVGFRLCVGDGFEAWSLARNNERIEKFVAAGPSGEQPIVGLVGSDPAGVARFTEPGSYVIAYRSNRAFTELPAAGFDDYLRDKGLEKIAAERKAKGTSRRKVREAYSRHSKALIRVGDAEGGVIDRRLNLRLELVAEPELFHAPDDDLRFFRLLHEGKPLAGALVVAARPGTADDDLRVRTDADGRAGLVLRAPGIWRVAAVHMIDAPVNVGADWESLWASLTFELRPPESATTRETRTAGNAACRNKVVEIAPQARP